MNFEKLCEAMERHLPITMLVLLPVGLSISIFGARYIESEQVLPVLGYSAKQLVQGIGIVVSATGLIPWLVYKIL